LNKVLWIGIALMPIRIYPNFHLMPIQNVIGIDTDPDRPDPDRLAPDADPNPVPDPAK
jgi:hypothetical protein